jgi:uncharacterized protein YggE
MTRYAWVFALLCISACSVADETQRSVTVTGTGSAAAEPDRATLTMSIMARKPALADAQAQATAVAARILELTDHLDIERAKVDTTGAAVRPDYQWDRDNNQQVLRGYIAERQMRVEINDLDKLGALTEGAVAAGVNHVSPPVLGSSKARETRRDALRAAARDAEANARALAESLGARLGEVITISSGQAIPRPIAARAQNNMFAMDENAAAATYNPADLDFNVTVTAVFALDD